VKDSLNQLLTDNQFHRINSSVPFITLYIKYGKEYVSVIQLLDFGNKRPVTGAEYNAYKSNAIAYIKSQGHNDIRFLTIIMSTHPEECRQYIWDDYNLWIIDTEINQLLIYERQPVDFCNLRVSIENLCLESGGFVSEDSYRPEQPAKIKNSFWKREFTVVNSLLVLLNIGIFIYLSVIGSTLDLDFMLDKGVMYVPNIVDKGEYYRFITCMFLHFGFQHLVGNMVVLLFLGDNVERNIGWWKYIFLYFGSGLIGSAGSFIYAYKFNQGIISAGSSGAIYGVIAALLWILIRNKGRIQDMTIIRVCVLIAYMLFSGFTSENIDMAAHLCGFAGGFLLSMILYRKGKVVN